MNRLECQVDTCRHYREGLCSLPGIQVEGPAAWESGQTCCASYEERGEEGGKNAAIRREASADSAIDCKAKHCVYNEDCRCGADCVCVGCSCEQVTAKSGTECCTFAPKK